VTISIATVARSFTGLIGFASIVWTVTAFPSFWADAGVFETAARVIAGEIYTVDAMKSLLAGSKPEIRRHPARLGPAAIIRLRQTELSLALPNERDASSQLVGLEVALAEALRSAPNSPYLWLALYWTKNRLHGFFPEHLKYLRMSYSVGPWEGWVAVKRNRISLGLYAVLPTDLRNNAFAEYSGLVRSQFYAVAVDLISSVSPVVREKISEELNRMGEADRRAMARMLKESGAFEIDIMGTNRLPPRPWQ
jgi:hypothetical protein